MAERLLAEGFAEQPALKAYAQALIENEKIVAARCVLQSALALAKKKDETEYLDLCAMMGRIHKQRFVTLVAQDVPAEQQNAELREAIKWYSKGTTDYHVVNLIALTSRALREQRRIAGPSIDVRRAAQDMLRRTSTKTKKEAWDHANAIEACLGLDKQPIEETLRWTYEFIDRGDVSAFQIASTLRQCEQIWQIAKGGNAAEQVTSVLRAALFERQGGAIDLTPSAALRRIEAALSDNGRRPVEWFQKAQERCRSVGLITTPDAKGTGFLVKGSDIEETWSGEPVFVTNSHVTLGDDLSSISVRFHAVEPNTDHRVTETLKLSAPESLDFAVYRLNSLPAGICCAPVVSRRPAPGTGMDERVYVVGHPGAGELCISLYNNVLVNVGDTRLHYTAATEPGSSGSPVFNESWEVIGLHHGVNVGYFPDGTKYSAQEGIVFEAIMDQAILEPLPTKKAAGSN